MFCRLIGAVFSFPLPFRAALAIISTAALSFTPPALASDPQALQITEFMAANRGALLDEDGDSSDWIEIFNPAATSASLAGWYLTDDADNLKKWQFPATNLPPNSFLIVFASGKNRALPGRELHTSFNLSASGEYLALVMPDGVTVASEFAPAFPQQYENISYGTGQNITANVMVSDRAPVRVLVPSSGTLGTSWTSPGFNDSTWRAGTNGVGYESSIPGFSVRNIKATIVVDSLNAADMVLATPSQQSAVYTENRSVINYLNTGSSGRYGNDFPFPGFNFTTDYDDFVLEALATVTIPAAGNWTFGVNSDDGFRLNVGSFTSSFPSPRGPADTLATFNFPSAGDYALRLVFYERGGGAEVELFAAQGSYSSWNPTNFRLVGDTANGGLAVRSLPVGSGTGYRSLIKTDLQAQMLHVNASAYVRIPFTATNAADLKTLTLRVKYDDGFIAYLNGVEVARRNAPAAPAWNSQATAQRPNDLALAYENIDVTAGVSEMREGNNVLAFHLLNASAADSDLLLVAELAEFRAERLEPQYFANPTPGHFNDSESYAKVDAVQFSHTRGFYETNFSLSLTSATPGSVVRYTLNGTAPTLANGFNYTSPLLLSTTAVVRAAAFRSGFVPSDPITHTYLFLEDVIRQSPNGQPPPGWPSSWGANVVDYGMDPRIVTNALWSATIKDDLKSIPSFSIVMNLADMFDSATGIYANPGRDGRAWERPASVELVHGDGKPGFHINAGIRIRGGFSRSTSNPKHALRLFFRSEYGASRLRYPLFGDDGAQSFDKMDLRTFQNYSWSFQGDGRGVFIRDQFSRDTQLDMGRPSTRGNFYHLYINGIYWGIFNTQERAEADFAATYFGDKEEDYDVIKVEAGPYTINPTDGNMEAWTRLWMAATNGFATDAAYQRIQGNNPDGTRNPAFENLLDAPNLIDYMLVIFYGGNLDAPISNFLGNNSPNNWYGIRSRTGSAGFRFFAHDSEHSLLNVNENRLGPYPAGNPSTGGGLLKSNPQYIFQQLQANAEFRMLVGDHVQRHFFNGGALTPEAARARFLRRSNELHRAVVGESARWGDAKRATPFTRNDWVNAVNDVVNTFLGPRSAVVLNQLRGAGLFPTVAAPLLSQFGGSVPPGYGLTLSNTNSTGGTIYFTLDGSDPRLPGGAIAPGAQAYAGPITLNVHTLVRARVRSGANWSALVEATFYTEQDFSSLLISEIMYNPPDEGTVSGDEFEFLELKNAGGHPIDLSGVSFTEGITFTFTNGTVLRPGEFFVLVRNSQRFQSKYPGVAFHGIFGGRLANGGETLTMTHLLGSTALTMTYSDRAPWPATPDGHGFSLVPLNANSNPDHDSPANWRASAEIGGSPGRDDPEPNIPRVLVNEILTAPGAGQRDAIELFNPGESIAAIGGWYLADDVAVPKKFRIPAGTTIAPGGYLVFDETHFNPTPGVPPSFSFSARGEEVYLFSGDAPGNLTGYAHGFRFGAAESGVSFGRYVTSTGAEHFPAQTSVTLGAANADPKVGPVVINEIMYHPAADGDEFIELKNISAGEVALFDPEYPTNTWRINGLAFVFPEGTVLPPNGFALVVGIDPGVFRSKYRVPENVAVFGPFSGVLQNNGERLRLQRPTAPDATGDVAWITVDEVRYENKAPWPPAANGDGPSLQRLNSAAYGNDPINWFTSGISAGAENLYNSSPNVSIISPASGAVFQAPATVLIEASAIDSDGTILNVEFFANGVKIAESSESPYRFQWINPGPNTYLITARAIDDGFATALSSPVTITVQPPPPGTGTGLRGEYYDNMNLTALRVTRIDSTVDFDWGTGSPDPSIGPDTFSVRWTGGVQPRYSDTYTFYTLSDDGVRLWVDDQLIIDNWTDHAPTENTGAIELESGRIYSIRMEYYENGGGATARLSWSSTFVPKEIIPRTQLYPDSPPSITAHPASGLAQIGSNVTLAVSAMGAAPLSYQWQFNGAPIPGATNSSLLLSNVQEISSGRYSVMVSNLLGSKLSHEAILQVGRPPIFLESPQDQVVLVGETVTFRVTMGGTPPFGFRWRRGTTTVVGLDQGTDTLTITNVQLTHAGTYTVVATNAFNLTPGVLSGGGILTVLVDSDGDGMPDTWETAHGFNPNSAADALLDSDGDGMTNLEEYIAGTDPRDPGSYLRIDAVQAGPAGESLLRFIAVSNRVYRVEYRDSLAEGAWLPLSSVGTQRTNRTVEIPDSGNGLGRFYRLLIPAR
jgi:hypothetical protein